VELAVLSLLTLAALFFGVRPTLRRLLPAEKVDTAAPETTAVVLGAHGRSLLVHGATGATIGVDRAGNPVVVREPILSEGPPDPAGQAKVPEARPTW
jgi:hypothetical protein